MSKENNKTQPPHSPQIFIEVDDAQYETYSTVKFEHRKRWENPDKGEIFAQIAGTIRHLYIEPKMHVKQNDKLLILEAMKMQNEFLSPIEGVIQEIYVNIGQNVAKGDVLLKIKPI